MRPPRCLRRHEGCDQGNPADPRDRINGGGAKYAVREVRDHILGNRFVLRTDVKSFYVGILNQFPEFVAFRSKHP
jgi:hypothetical protein